MHYAIIAAGEGSRLRQEGVRQDKPLVPIQGLPMIDRLMAIFCRCHAESISVICNGAMPEVCRHLQQTVLDVPLHVIERQTPSSMHSLACLSEVIPEGRVCVTTVDTIFREPDFAAYVAAFEQADGPLFAVTPFVDDEKPLWVTVDEPTAQCPAITAFCDQRPDDPHCMVSGGIYGLDTSTAWPILHQCLAEGQSRMRNYQRALLAAGLPIRAFVLGQVMDIDHASDIVKAEAWLSQRRLLAIARSPEHSPNNVESDRTILQAVADELQHRGADVTLITEREAARLTRLQLQTYDAIFHMARWMGTLTRLSQAPVPVVNDPRSVMQVAGSREYVLSVLQASGIPVPAWWAYDPEADEMFQCEPGLQQLLPGWVKATRPEGARPDDVSWVDSPLMADARIIELAAESVPDIVVTRHLEGDLLKVYCVGGRVLHAFYPQERGYSKFGQQEQHNTPLARTPYDPAALSALAGDIARALRLQVFGFDAIIGPDGSVTVIDVNDWPSFSSCRDAAAPRIADLIVKLTFDC